MEFVFSVIWDIFMTVKMEFVNLLLLILNVKLPLIRIVLNVIKGLLSTQQIVKSV